MLVLKSWDREEFVRELDEGLRDKDIVTTQATYSHSQVRSVHFETSSKSFGGHWKTMSPLTIESLEVEFNDQLMKNIEVFFNSLLKLEKLEKILFVKSKSEEFDMVCFSRAKNYFRVFFGKLYLRYKITFVGFSQDLGVLEIIGKRNYFIYCNMNNLKVKWEKGMIEKEKNLIIKYSNMKKYVEFNYIESIFENFPVSSFNFPTEDGVDRFVYYYYVYDEETKLEFLKIMEKLNFDLNYLNYVKNASINIPVSYYALGFSYKNNCLIRKTFYFAFFDPFNLEKINEYFQKILNINISNFKVDSILYAGIDIYESHTELKIYEEGSLFKHNLVDKDLEQVLSHKFANHVLKIKNGEVIAEKFEFEIKKYFNEKEKEILRRKKLIEDTPKVLALYIKDKIIIKSVFYDL